MAEHVCPWWMGYLLASPVRRLFERPEDILDGLVTDGMVALDVGCAMGFFSIPIAKMVGHGGRVVCVDLQQRMLESLDRRAQRAGVKDRLELRKCSKESLGIEDLSGDVSFALAYAMVHEVPDATRLFEQIYQSLKIGGQFLMAEPRGHVSGRAFDESLKMAFDIGFVEVQRPTTRRAHTVVLRK
ncbi:MAG: class I SAM-dependent methyltransferase [Proteobacteria bacterium]|nr:class I SAM-dependent methyltransferase [Pseudomonadota bacterium]